MASVLLNVLGLNLQLVENKKGYPLYLEISVPVNRVRVIGDMVDIAVAQIREKKLTVKLIQQTAGSIISAIFHRRHKVQMHKLKTLFLAAEERRFPTLIRKKPFREALIQTLLELKNVVRTSPPLRISADIHQKRLAIGYSDASLEGGDSEERVAMLAGVIFLCGEGGELSTNVRFSYSIRIENPAFSIAIYEALALLLLMARFPPKMYAFFRLAFGIDNSNVLYAISRGFSGSLELAAAIGMVLEATREGTSFFYTPSKLNFADILTRTNRMEELAGVRFIEDTSEDLEQFKKVSNELKKRINELECEFCWKIKEHEHKRRKLG